ncbi:MAG: hypothetical protein M1828_000094 [Chrysothrix sp. TS-e1954]|nr:MAG: hypothetical protein M1828_000094 [Chrysothrix sp. TS-e1954]
MRLTLLVPSTARTGSSRSIVIRAPPFVTQAHANHAGNKRRFHQAAASRFQNNEGPDAAHLKQSKTWGKLAKEADLPQSTQKDTTPRVQNGKSIVVTEVDAPHLGVIKVVSLNEASSMNALSRNMVNEISDVIESIHTEPLPGHTRALVLASESEKAFCAGANLKERASMTIEEANAFLTKLRKTFTRISELPIPTIAAVNGTALGGGLELALCAHLRVFSPNAIVGLPEVRLGIIPGAGGTYRLPAAIGLSRAREMMLTGRRISGKQASGYGLCHVLSEHVGADKLEDKRQVLVSALKLAKDVTSGAPLATRALLKATQDGGSPSDENDAYDTIIRTRDRNEALAAFREKRAAVFTGE